MRRMTQYIQLLALTAWLSYGYCQVDKFIGYFETLDYDSIHKQVKTGRRASDRSMDKALFIDFKAFGRTFNLILSQDVSSLAPATEKKASYNRRVYLYPNSVVAGDIAGEISRLHGMITDNGLFYGTIKSQYHTFHIEPAEKYFEKPNFHSVIYRSLKSELNSKVLQRLRSDLTKYGSRKQAPHSRKKRALTKRDAKIMYDQKVCRLSLEADYTFLEMSGSPEHAISLMVNHIEALNKIFRKSFVSSNNKDNETLSTPQANDSVTKFQIARVRVYNVSETDRVLAPGGLDAATFLRLMQKSGGYSHFCLALFFTARSFTDGVVGVTNPGGACTTSNVGVVSFAREDMILPPLVTEINVAQVVGIAFGAKHDEGSCQPDGSEDGDFIMTKFGLNGDQPNNFLYSPCSVQQIQSFVDSAQDVHCLELDSSTLSYCGNSVVENGEECDCGDETTCSVLESGKCCDFTSCKLKAHATCSVSNGFCCDGTTCNYKNSANVCSFETDCSNKAVCPGNSSICPQPSHKSDFLECNWNSSVCMNGSCSGISVCIKFGLESCSCKDKMNECKICCLDGDKCWPAQNITKIKSRLKSVYLSAGSLCANRTGYCDVFHECHPIALNAPFSHRYDPYVRKKGIKEITHSFWWAIFLGTVALIAGVVMIIKHGVLYTPSSNPELNELEPTKPLPRLKLSRLKSEEEKEIIHSDGMA